MGGNRGCPLGASAWLIGVVPIFVGREETWSLFAVVTTLPHFFQDLLDPARWRMLIQQFRYDNYRLHQLGNNSVFTLTLQAGLSAIKTPYPSRWECSPCAPFPVQGCCADPTPYQPWSQPLKQRLQCPPGPDRALTALQPQC